jgi:hypothetical protein
MGWVDQAHKRHKIYKMVNNAMKDPKYLEAEKKKMEDATWDAFDKFLLISADYLHRYCGYGKKRILKYIDFVVYQMHCIETDPDYFELLNDALEEETGVNILKNLVK